MKISLRLFFLIFGFCVFAVSYSCSSNRSDNGDNQLESSYNKLLTDDSLSSILWEYDVSADSMVSPQQKVALTTEMVVDILNQRYADNMYLDLLSVSADTAFVHINDATYLTHQLGSTGAFGYLAEVTYSLTEVPGIHFVHFDFQEGDHATPGLYKRKDFLNKL